MKRLCVVVAGTAALMSSAVVYAGGCNYGKQVASEESSSPVISAVDEADTVIIEGQRVVDNQAAVEALIQTPVVHN